jgi:hypothetical protein
MNPIKTERACGLQKFVHSGKTADGNGNTARERRLYCAYISAPGIISLLNGC